MSQERAVDFSRADSDGVTDTRGPVRETWVDAARGVGILAVVTGHVAVNQSGIVWAWLSWGLYLFHMPLFFVLSGYLFRPSDIGAMLRSRVRSLILPYAAFLLTLMALTIGMEAAAQDPLSAGEIEDLARDAMLGGPYLTGNFGVFWFVTNLFVGSMAYGALRRSSGLFAALTLTVVLSAVLLADALEAVEPDLRVPWSMNTVPVAMACLWAGEAVRAVGLHDRRLLAASAATVAACIGLGQAGVPFSFDMKAGEFGPPILGLALALALSVLLARVVMAACRTGATARMLAWVGAASLVVMFLHQFVQLTLLRMDAPAPVVLLLSILLPLAAHAVVSRSAVLSPIFLGRTFALAPGPAKTP